MEAFCTISSVESQTSEIRTKGVRHESDGHSCAIVAYLRSPLHNILVELCGTRERAAFWVSFSNVTITLVPLIFAMQYTPDLKAGSSAVLELAAQLKWALAGLLFAVLILGWVLKGFIHRQAGQVVTKQPTPAVVV